MAQVALNRGWLECSLNDAGRVVFLSRGSCSQANSGEDEAQTKVFQVSHIR